MARAKPEAPRLESALFWASLANLAGKRAEECRIGLELGQYKVAGRIGGEVFLGGRRKPQPIEAIWSADLTVGKPQPTSSSPTGRVVLAGLLAIIDRVADTKTARAIRRRISRIDGDKLTADQLDEAAEILDSLKRTKRGTSKRVGVCGQLDEVVE